jgi:hypothetical protein
MTLFTAVRLALAAAWILAIMVGLRTRLPAVKVTAPIGVIGLSTTARYFLSGVANRILLVSIVAATFAVCSWWMVHLLSQQRAWRKSRNH